MKLYIEQTAFKSFIEQLKDRKIDLFNYMMFMHKHLDVIYTFVFDESFKNDDSIRFAMPMEGVGDNTTSFIKPDTKINDELKTEEGKCSAFMYNNDDLLGNWENKVLIGPGEELLNRIKDLYETGATEHIAEIKNPKPTLNWGEIIPQNIPFTTMVLYDSYFFDNFLYKTGWEFLKQLYLQAPKEKSTKFVFVVNNTPKNILDNINVNDIVINKGTQLHNYFKTTEDLSPLEILGITTKYDTKEKTTYYTFNNQEYSKTNLADYYKFKNTIWAIVKRLVESVLGEYFTVEFAQPDRSPHSRTLITNYYRIKNEHSFSMVDRFAAIDIKPHIDKNAQQMSYQLLNRVNKVDKFIPEINTAGKTPNNNISDGSKTDNIIDINELTNRVKFALCGASLKPDWESNLQQFLTNIINDTNDCQSKTTEQKSTEYNLIDILEKKIDNPDYTLNKKHLKLFRTDIGTLVEVNDFNYLALGFNNPLVYNQVRFETLLKDILQKCDHTRSTN